MKYFISTFSVLLAGTLHAQEVSPATINTSGVAGVANNIYFDFNLGESFTTTIGNSLLLTQGVLQPLIEKDGSLPVTGLHLAAKRIDKDNAQLNWQTMQEFNNRGFYIERRYESENDFTQLKFVQSKAPNGTSNLPLDYNVIDVNSFAGKSYYRLKQTDLNGKATYSLINVVNGISGKRITLKAWPNPSSGNVSVIVEGAEKDMLQLVDISGKMIRQIPVVNGKQEQILGLQPGIYILKLANQKDLLQKLIIQ
jgi:hypothetical protein